MDAPANQGSVEDRAVRNMKLQGLFKNNLVASEVGFKPTREQSLSRIDFHSAFNSGKMVHPNGKLMSMAEALAVIRKNALLWHDDFGKWMKIKGFWLWFQRPPVTELSRMAALLVESSCNCLYRILESDDPKLAAAQVSASRTALELANAFPNKKVEVTTMDDAVRNMSEQQKRALIAEAAKLSTPEPSVLDSELGDMTDA